MTRPSARPATLDPENLLQPQISDSFRAFCREQFAQMRGGSLTRWLPPAALFLVSLGAWEIIILYTMELGEKLSLAILLVVVPGSVCLYMRTTYSSYAIDWTSYLAVCSVLAVHTVLVVKLALWMMPWVNNAGVIFLVVATAVGSLGAFPFTIPTTFRARLTRQISEALGMQYSDTAEAMPSGRSAAAGMTYGHNAIDTHITGVWKGVKFHASRYGVGSENGPLLLVRCMGVARNVPVLEATTFEEFPDEGPDPDRTITGLGPRLRVRILEGELTEGARKWIAATLNGLAGVTLAKNIFVTVVDGDLIVFAESEDRAFDFSEIGYWLDQAALTDEVRANFSLMMHIVEIAAAAAGRQG